MKFQVKLSGKTLYSFMRQAGYAPHKQDARTNEFAFNRSITGAQYPKFHVYATETNGTANLDLHLDQKGASYTGTTLHSGEYNGQLVETEASRIQKMSGS